jgi:mitogen-activated protein kinase kinase
MSAVNGSGEANHRLRSESFTVLDGRASGPESAASSQYSALSSFMGTRQGQVGTPDNPSSAISSVYSDAGGVAMEREGSMGGLLPDLEKLSLEKGRPLDVEDLDDEGWRAASDQKKIVELGSLGEGAGGAVTRCILQGGKTVFALKVRRASQSSSGTRSSDF